MSVLNISNDLQNVIKKIASDTNNGDTLPIGAIVEFDGTTVPNGYEQISPGTSLYLTATVDNVINIPKDYWKVLPLVRLDSQTTVSESKLKIVNGKIKIGAGVNHIRVSCGVFVEGMENTTYAWASIGVNGVSVMQAIHSGSYFQSCIISPRILNVSAGDLIDMGVNTSSNNGARTRSGPQNVWLLIEILD